MRYLADPTPTQTAAPYDDTALRDAIAQLTANETADDATVAALDALVKAIKIPDLSGYALKTDIPGAIASSEASITPIFDPLPAPSPIITPATLSGATLVGGVVGSKLVNNALVHSFARTSSPPAPNTWSTNLTIPPVTGACKVRFGITSAIQGTIEVSIDGAAPLTASNTGFGWSGSTSAIPAFVDGAYSWFEVAIAQSVNPVSVAIKIPTGRGLLPTIYAANAITSLVPAEPTGLRLTDPRTGKEMIYRPSDFATSASIPKAFDPTSLTNRILDLENKPSVVPSGLVAFSSEANLTSQINAAHPSGGTFGEWVVEGEGNAIDITLGSNVTAATLKTELGMASTDMLIRVKAGITDAIIANASLIPAGLYRLWQAGGQIRIRVLDS